MGMNENSIPYISKETWKLSVGWYSILCIAIVILSCLFSVTTVSFTTFCHVLDGTLLKKGRTMGCPIMPKEASAENGAGSLEFHSLKLPG
jgi:hypothetical protein